MDQQTPTPNPSSAATTAVTPSPVTHTPVTPTPTTSADASQPTEPSPPQPSPAPQSQPSQPPSFTATATTSIITSTLPPPAPNPNPNPPPRQTHPVAPTTTNISSSVVAARPQLIHRPWQHPHPHSHFSQLSSSISPPIPSPQPRGSVAIGVPASHPTPSPPSFSSSFSQQFTGLNRGPVNVADSVTNASNAQMRMMSPMSSSTSMRPAGIPVHHQPRPGVQASLRPSPSPQPPSPNNQTPTTQNFQGHGFMRSPSPGPPVSPVTATPQRPLSVGPVGSPAPSTSLRPTLGGPPAPNASQSMQSPNQPWLSTGQGKPPLPSPSYRPSMNPPSMQQRSHIPSQHSVTASPQQQHVASTQPQPLSSNQPPDHFGQQFPPARGPQSLPHQQQLSRGQVTTHQKSSPLAAVQPNIVQPVLQNRAASNERDESGNRILSKRSIHELVNQIDSSERLDREVEDILADIADEFVESITTFGCSLAKHRKSDTLEAKDILLHVEKNWNITLPGFGGDEIKTYRKPLTNDIHKERLAAVKKSIMTSEVASAKNPAGQASANAKSSLTKTPASSIVSPNLKVT